MTTARSELSPGEIHLWWFRLDGSVSGGHSLSPDEIARAEAFAFDHLRRRFVAGRHALRRILATYAGIGSRSLEIGPDPRGKPVLLQAAGIHFNLAHSGEVAVLAVARDGPVGIDVERRRSLDDLEAMIARVLTPEEAATLPRAARADAFWTAWTRKEAVAKATGLGLRHSPASFAVRRAEDRCALPVTLDGRDWWVRDLPAPDGFAAALASPLERPRLVIPWSHEALGPAPDGL